MNKLPKFKRVPQGKPLPNMELINLEGNFTFCRQRNITCYRLCICRKQSHLKTVSHVFYEPSGEDLSARYMVMPNRNDLDKYPRDKGKDHRRILQSKGWKLPLLVVKIARSAE